MFKVRPIKSNFVAFDEWIEVKEGQSIIVLEEHDLTGPIRAAPGRAASAVAAAAASVAAASAVAATPAAQAAPVAQEAVKVRAAWSKCDEVFDMAKQEIQNTGKIKGFSVLVGDKLVWLSHYDFKELSEMPGACQQK